MVTTPGLLNLTEQLRMWADADVVLALQGSHMSLSFCLRPGAVFIHFYRLQLPDMAMLTVGAKVPQAEIWPLAINERETRLERGRAYPPYPLNNDLSTKVERILERYAE